MPAPPSLMNKVVQTVATNTVTQIMNYAMTNTASTSAVSNVWIPISGGTSTNLVGWTDTNMNSNAWIALDILRSGGLDIGNGDFLKLDDKARPYIEHHHGDGLKTRTRVHRRVHTGVVDFSGDTHEFAPGTFIKLTDGTYLQIDKDKKLVHQSFENARKEVINVTGGDTGLYESLAFNHFGDIHIPEGCNIEATFTLPNGVMIKLFRDDHVEVDDSQGFQLYRSAPARDFNRFLNASDLLEEFISYCAQQRVTKKDFAELPISLFIYWLIVRAAETDGDPTEEVVPLLTSAVKQRKAHTHRCRDCGKFLTKRYEDNGISFCSSQHMDHYLERIAS